MNLVEGEHDIQAWLLQAGFQPGDLHSELIIEGTSNCPMTWACRNGQLSVCQWLFEMGAARDIRKADNNGITPMILACLKGHLAVCRWLFEVGAAEDIRKANNEGYTPMFLACQEGHLSVMKYLILNSALNRPVSGAEKESDAVGHIDHTIVEHDIQPSHRPALFDWAQKLLSSHTLFVDVVLTASVVLQARRARQRCRVSPRRRCYLLLLPRRVLEMLRMFLGVEKGRALRNARELSEIMTSIRPVSYTHLRAHET